jgi:hypothetical protein
MTENARRTLEILTFCITPAADFMHNMDNNQLGPGLCRGQDF